MTPVRVVGVILYRHGKFLLQLRDDNPEIASPGMWACFGGHIDPGEDVESAARREIEEETGFRIEGPLEPVLHENEEEREVYFFAAPLLVPIAGLSLGEGQDMRLFSPEEFDRIPLVPSHLRLLRLFVERN